MLAWWDGFSDAGRTLLLLASAVVIIVDLIGAACIKLAQGQWESIPRIGNGLTKKFRSHHAHRAEMLRQRRNELSWKWLARYQPPSEFPELWTGREPAAPISEIEERALQRVDAEIANMPLPNNEWSTRTGNSLRAAAQHSQRYGLDAEI